MDKKYVSYFINTVIRICVFIIMCALGSFMSNRLVPSPYNKLVPAGIAIILSWFFLTVIEGDKRSFFAKGYVVENVVPGGVWGFGAAIAGPFIAIILKHRYFNWDAVTDVTGNFFDAIASGLFLAIVVYGYIFHIICSDFGFIPAVIVSSVMFGVFASASVSSGIMPFDAVLIPAAVYYGIIGAGAGMLIVGLGDMRSAAAYLFIFCITKSFADDFIVGGNDFFTDLAAPVMSVLCGISMYLELRRDREQKKKSYNYK